MTDPSSRFSSPSESDTVTVPLAEDTLQVHRRDVIARRVRVRTETHTQTQMVPADIMEEHVDIERVPVDREVDEPPQVRVEDGVTIVPVLDEVVVVETRLVLREELHIRKRQERRAVEIPVETRHQTAVVEEPPDISADASADPSNTSGKGSTP